MNRPDSISGRPWGLAEALVYRFFDADGELLYVGCTFDMGPRIAQHRRDKRWWEQVVTVTLERHPDRRTALDAEAAAIADERPRYNRAGQLKAVVS